MRGSRLVFAELKSEDGRPTAARREWLDALAAADCCEVYLWRPSQLGEIAECLHLRQRPNSAGPGAWPPDGGGS